MEGDAKYRDNLVRSAITSNSNNSVRLALNIIKIPFGTVFCKAFSQTP